MPSTPGTVSYLRRYALCIAALALSLILFPLVALVPTVAPVDLPRWLGNGLFFWPQVLLLPSGLQSASSAAVVGATLAPFAAAAFWLLAVAGLARLTLPWPIGWALVALFVAVALVAELMLFAFSSLGFRVVLDGL